jgi:conjugal transfer pilin signal peptidase TrbI
MDTLYAHFLRQYLSYMLLLLTYLVFSLRYEFAINVSMSLPGKLYLIEKATLPHKGEYVAFTYQNDFIYPKGVHLLKRVAGVSGDSVQLRDHKHYVDGYFVGEARPFTSQGLPIQESEFTGVIPNGYYYAQADHPKSFDSRYAAIGLVASNCIIGRAYKLF